MRQETTFLRRFRGLCLRCVAAVQPSSIWASALVRPRDADALREGDRVAIDPATVLSEEPAS